MKKIVIFSGAGLSAESGIPTLLEQAGVPNVQHLQGRIDYQKYEWHLEIPPLGGFTLQLRELYQTFLSYRA